MRATLWLVLVTCVCVVAGLPKMDKAIREFDDTASLLVTKMETLEEKMDIDMEIMRKRMRHEIRRSRRQRRQLLTKDSMVQVRSLQSDVADLNAQIRVMSEQINDLSLKLNHQEQADSIGNISTPTRSSPTHHVKPRADFNT